MAQLICGTCGRYYQVKLPKGVKSQYDCDNGYGICPKDKKVQDEQNEAEWVKAENLLAGALNPENAKKFRAMELGVRRGLILQAIEDGMITWEIKSRPLINLTTVLTRGGI